MFFGFGVLLVLVVAVIVVAAVIMRRRGEGGVEVGPGALRRVFYYVLSFAALMLAANGAVALVRYVAESISTARDILPSDTDLALGLSLTIVGTPVWLLFWTLAQRSVQQSPSETQSLARKLYIYLVLAVSLGLLIQGLVSLLQWLLGATEFEGNSIAFPLVWGTVWAFHWRVEAQEGQPTELTRTIHRVYVYAASAVTLAMLTIGVAVIVWQLLQEAYNALFLDEVVLRLELWNDTLRTGIALMLVGSLGWWWHWVRVSSPDAGSLLRQLYLYVLGILGGAATVVVSLSILLFGVLSWFMGAPGLPRAEEQFRFMPGILAAVMVGLGLWGYHWSVVRQEAHLAAGRLVAARRVYHYLVAALGLGTLASGLVFLVALAVELLVPEAREPLSRGQWWKGPLALVITLLLVGGPLWGFYWFGAQREATASPEARAALSRRGFIYLVFGVSVLAALGSLSFLLFTFLQDLLQEELTLDVFRTVKWSIGILLTTGTLSVYYWLVLQEDRRVLAPLEAAAPPTIARKRVTILAPEQALPLVRRLESELGYPVSLWRRLDGDIGVPSLTDEELRQVQESIAQAPGQQVLLTVDASGLHVVPYSEG